MAVAWYLTWPSWLLGLGAFFGAASLDWEMSRVWAITILVHVTVSCFRFRSLHGRRFGNVRVLIAEADESSRPNPQSSLRVWLKTLGAGYLLAIVVYALAEALQWKFWKPTQALANSFLWPPQWGFCLTAIIFNTVRSGSSEIRIKRVP